MTVGTDDLRFNAEVKVDKMWIKGKTVLKMADLSTNFTAAVFFISKSVE